MKFSKIFQTAYVTDDVDRAGALFADLHGVKSFYNPGVSVSPTESGETMEMLIVHAWWGDRWLEVIQPVGGAVDVYRNWLPPGGGVRFHHFGLVVESLEDYQRCKSRELTAGRKLAFSINHENGIKLFYVDTVEELGHYTEYLFFPPDIEMTLFDDMPKW